MEGHLLSEPHESSNEAKGAGHQNPHGKEAHKGSKGNGGGGLRTHEEEVQGYEEQ